MFHQLAKFPSWHICHLDSRVFHLIIFSFFSSSPAFGEDIYAWVRFRAENSSWCAIHLCSFRNNFKFHQLQNYFPSQIHNFKFHNSNSQFYSLRFIGSKINFTIHWWGTTSSWVPVLPSFSFMFLQFHASFCISHNRRCCMHHYYYQSYFL